MITQEQLIDQLHYDPTTGIFIWIKNSDAKSTSRWSGKHAGWKDEQGYIHIRIKKELQPAARLAFLYMTGAFPVGIVDHKNLNTSDNRWNNLRDVTKKTNQENRHKAGKNNKSGLLGVCVKGNRYAAKIMTGRVAHYLGTFDTAERAHEAYVEAKRRLHEGCTL